MLFYKFEGCCMNLCKHLVILSVFSLSIFAMYADPEISCVQVVEDEADLFELEQQLLILKILKNRSGDKDLEENIIAVYAKINKLLQKDIEYMDGEIGRLYNRINDQQKDTECMRSEINRLEKYTYQQHKNKEKWHRRDVNQAFKKAFIKGSIIGVCCSFLAIVSSYFAWNNMKSVMERIAKR